MVYVTLPPTVPSTDVPTHFAERYKNYQSFQRVFSSADPYAHRLYSTCISLYRFTQEYVPLCNTRCDYDYAVKQGSPNF